MASSAGRYLARAPRYILRPLDSSFMRYAPMHTRGVASAASVHDLSESGLAFTLKGGDVPDEGETIKVEFNVPGRKQIACYASVTRVEPLTAWDPVTGESETVKVALHFRELPEAHRRALQLSLENRVRINPEDGGEEQLDEKIMKLLTQRPPLKTVVGMAFAGAALVALFHLMTTSPEALVKMFF